MPHARPAKTYPDSVFSQTSPDETQTTEGTIRLTTLVKDCLLYTSPSPRDED